MICHTTSMSVSPLVVTARATRQKRPPNLARRHGSGPYSNLDPSFTQPEPELDKLWSMDHGRRGLVALLVLGILVPASTRASSADSNDWGSSRWVDFPDY